MVLEAADGVSFEVEARLSACVEPVDGRLHVTGRIAPHAEVAALVRGGVRRFLLDGVPVRLTEVDPWGGILVRY